MGWRYIRSTGLISMLRQWRPFTLGDNSRISISGSIRIVGKDQDGTWSLFGIDNPGTECCFFVPIFLDYDLAYVIYNGEEWQTVGQLEISSLTIGDKSIIDRFITMNYQSILGIIPLISRI